MLRTISWRPIAAATLAVVAGAAFALLLVSLSDRWSGDDPAAADRAAAASGSVAASGAPTLGPTTTPAPRAAWTTAFSIEPGPYSRLAGVAEARDTLFALGRSDHTQPAIWWSRDGSTWTSARLPAVTERLSEGGDSSAELTAIVVDLEDAGDRLVALGAVGLADGSGLFGTMLYSSDDAGLSWSVVTNTPGTTAAAMFDPTRLDDRLIAVGTAIWASDDGGLSWSEVVDGATVGGILRSASAGGNLVVAVGDGGDGDLAGPPAVAMLSTDGQRWDRVLLDPSAGALSVAVGTSDNVIVGGYFTTNQDQPIWMSSGDGGPWDAVRLSQKCCAMDLVVTPEGFVAGMSGGLNGVLRSADGTVWTDSSLTAGLTHLTWGPRFGLTGTTADNTVIFDDKESAP